MPARLFGDIPGVRPGDWFPNRASLAESGVHPPGQAGISGDKELGADSIVLSGGYEDDEDLGDVIIYTGHGGNDPTTGRQDASQSLSRGNLALAISCREGLPVRVSRGSRVHSPYSPVHGYVYAGLYQVEGFWQERGRSGFNVWRFRLHALTDTELSAMARAVMEIGPEYDVGDESTERRPITIQRIIRNSQYSDAVKRYYGYRCQVCRDEVRTAAGLYVEAAHIKPLGSPHDGPDTLTNLLCLCPNHHVSPDLGGIFLTDRWEVIDATSHVPVGVLRRNPRHPLDPTFAAYHRRLFGDQT